MEVPSEAAVKLTLSIWRDFVPPRPLALDANDDDRRFLDAESALQEQVYAWRLREDPFGGIPDDATRRDLRERLVERLADAKPPAERSLSKLQEFIDAAQDVIDDNAASPVHSESRVIADYPADDPGAVEANHLLALTIHLRWIIACFGDRPGISVSVR